MVITIWPQHFRTIFACVHNRSNAFSTIKTQCFILRLLRNPPATTTLQPRLLYPGKWRISGNFCRPNDDGHHASCSLPIGQTAPHSGASMENRTLQSNSSKELLCLIRSVASTASRAYKLAVLQYPWATANWHVVHYSDTEYHQERMRLVLTFLYACMSPGLLFVILPIAGIWASAHRDPVHLLARKGIAWGNGNFPSPEWSSVIKYVITILYTARDRGCALTTLRAMIEHMVSAICTFTSCSS